MTQIAHFPTQLSVLGAGAWGTVLAHLLAKNGHEVNLWARDETQAKQMTSTRRNERYAPDLILASNISISSDLAKCVRDAQAIIWAVPSQAARALISQVKDIPAIISCSKGIESVSSKTMTEVLAESSPKTLFAALSGPNLAGEIAQGKPAAATLASHHADFAIQAQSWFNQASFRVYTSSDLKGVEIAGAVKNIIALAAGMSDGLNLGDNAKASLLTRGLAEMVRLGKHMGGKTETFYGLAGLGDLVATCSSLSSRNHRAGELFSQGKTLEHIQNMNLTAEGIPTVKAVYDYSVQANLDLPITTEVFRVVYENKAPQVAIQDLMRREVKGE